MSQPSFSVTVDGLALSVDEKILSLKFRQHEGLLSVSIVPSKTDSNKRFGYVNFSNEEIAKKAALEMNGKSIHGYNIVTKVYKPKMVKRELTDCKYNQGCSPPDGQGCPYRHNIVSDTVCSNWLTNKCKRKQCPNKHPSKEENQAVAVKKPSESHEEFEELCKCAICLDRIEDPRTLNCDHSFCKECLNETVKFECDTVFLTCSTCNSITFLNPGETVDSIKTTLHLKQILDILNKTTGDTSLSCKMVKCSLCDKTSTSYCEDCSEFLCDNCVKVHKGQKNTCEHFHPVRFFRNLESVMPYCEAHKCIEHHGCRKCVVTACLFCLKKEHSGHESSHERINIFVNQFKESLTNNSSNIEDRKKAFDTLLDKLINVLSLAECKTTEIKKKIREKKMIILSQVLFMLDKAEEKVLDDVTVVHSEFEKIIESQCEECSVKLSRYNSVINSSESLLCKSDIEIITQANKVVENMKRVGMDIETPEDPSYPDFQIRMKDTGCDNRLFELLYSMFGDIQLSLVEDIENFETVNMQVDRNSMLNEDFFKLSQKDEAKSFVQKKIKELSLNVHIDATANDVKTKKSRGKKKKGKRITESAVDESVVVDLLCLDQISGLKVEQSYSSMLLFCSE